MSAPVASDPFAPVLRSPELVGAHDKGAWLTLFTEDGSIEDPVGAGAYVGRDRHSAFWDAFIAPNRVTFHGKRDFRSGDVVVRYVTISSITPVSEHEPFALPAIIEYRVRGERLASLRAFWEPRLAVGWHARKGLRGLMGLSKHGLRMTGGLGVSSAMGFSRALVPGVSKKDGRALAERLASAIGRSRGEWLELTRTARVSIAELPPASGERRDATEAWKILERVKPLAPEEVIVAGDHLACVLSGGDGPAAAILARVARGHIEDLRLIWSV